MFVTVCSYRKRTETGRFDGGETVSDRFDRRRIAKCGPSIDGRHCDYIRSRVCRVIGGSIENLRIDSIRFFLFRFSFFFFFVWNMEEQDGSRLFLR